LRAHIVRHSEDGHIRVDCIPIEAGWPLPERCVPDEGEVQSAAFITAFGHGISRADTPIFPPRRRHRNQRLAYLHNEKAEEEHQASERNESARYIGFPGVRFSFPTLTELGSGHSAAS
jgi:hypothetical protein